MFKNIRSKTKNTGNYHLGVHPHAKPNLMHLPQEELNALAEKQSREIERDNMMLDTIKIKKLHPDAITPTRSHPHDAGLDIYAAETVALRPQGQHILKTGIAVNIPPGYVGLLTSRSGVSSRTKLVIETGKIDSGYNGELGINIKNDDAFLDTKSQLNNMELSKGFAPLMYNVKGEKIENGNPFQHDIGKVYRIDKGDKIAQLLIVPIVTPSVEIVEELESESARGTNGFGSTDN